MHSNQIDFITYFKLIIIVLYSTLQV